MPDTENRLVVAKRRGGGGMDREFVCFLTQALHIHYFFNFTATP